MQPEREHSDTAAAKRSNNKLEELNKLLQNEEFAIPKDDEQDFDAFVKKLHAKRQTEKQLSFGSSEGFE